MTIGSALARAIRHPGLAYTAAMAYVRGYYYRVKFRLLGRKVIIGKRFRVRGRLDIRGPGTVIFGDYCGVVSSRYQATTPWTHSPEAVIRFGDHVLLTGTRLGCVSRIEVGDYAGLSDARIMDTDFHAIETGDAAHRGHTKGRTKAVIIARNVWLGAGSMVLKGVTIGENAVVGAGSVVAGNVPANAVVFGNPARVIWRVRPKAPAAQVAADAASAAQSSSAAADDGSENESKTAQSTAPVHA